MSRRRRRRATAKYPMRMRDLIDIVLGDQTLTEARAAPLYHFTSELGAILRSNRLSPGENGRVSLTRETRHDFYGDANTALILDQAALATKFRMHPHRGDAEGMDEAEEFVTKPIHPLNQYLIGISLQRDTYEAAKRSDDASNFSYGAPMETIERLLGHYRSEGVKVMIQDRNVLPRTASFGTPPKNQRWFRDFR